MDVVVKGKNLDVGDALRTHVTDALNTGVAKFFNNSQDSSVTFSKETYQFRADITVHVGRDILVQGSGLSNDAYGAFDTGLERILKQLRRYKRRLVDRNRSDANADFEAFSAQQYLLAGDDEEEAPEDLQPTIVAEMQVTIPTLTVGEAVMRMDLTDLPAFMFRNSAHGGLNMVYRRNDGHIGWIDPELTDK